MAEIRNLKPSSLRQQVQGSWVENSVINVLGACDASGMAPVTQHSRAQAAPHHVSRVFSGKSTHLGAFLRWGEHSTHTHSVYDPGGAYSKHVLYLLRKILLGFPLRPKAAIYEAQQIYTSHLPLSTTSPSSHPDSGSSRNGSDTTDKCQWR